MINRYGIVCLVLAASFHAEGAAAADGEAAGPRLDSQAAVGVCRTGECSVDHSTPVTTVADLGYWGPIRSRSGTPMAWYAGAHGMYAWGPKTWWALGRLAVERSMLGTERWDIRLVPSVLAGIARHPQRDDVVVGAAGVGVALRMYLLRVPETLTASVPENLAGR